MEGEDVERLGPGVVFNRKGWTLDFADAVGKLRLLCEQWLYACGCGNCDTCSSCSDLLLTLKNLPCVRWEDGPWEASPDVVTGGDNG